MPKHPRCWARDLNRPIQKGSNHNGIASNLTITLLPGAVGVLIDCNNLVQAIRPLPFFEFGLDEFDDFFLLISTTSFDI